MDKELLMIDLLSGKKVVTAIFFTNLSSAFTF